MTIYLLISEVSARNTALWTAESSSRTAPDDKSLEIRHLFQYFIFLLLFFDLSTTSYLPKSAFINIIKICEN